MCAGELKADINQTLEAFEHVLHLYRSGLHLDDLPPSELTGNSWGGDGRSFFFIPSFHPTLFWRFHTTFSLRLCFHFISQEGKKKKKGKVVFFSARAALTGLLGSWNERTRATERD